ncbi:kynurenine formamidase-like [Amphibalanus amphitrite]|uniref:kynurenine formamidase-like n=1 Tax=Amphibalanus amphitrite TaxID=1232801 RepID=UPI001C8FB2C9|nr:kynurenine formamidase-like [Amphibalanus amphitrite]
MASSAADLEQQYSPSAWVQRVAPSEVVRLFAEAVTAAAQRARASLPCELDIRYGDGPEQRYSVLGTNVPDDAPLAVFIHGGYWQEMDLASSDGVALGFHRLGWRTVTVGYDLAPAVTLDEIVAQVRTVGRRILQMALDLRSRAVLLFGHSAGAQLVAMLLADWSTLGDSERPPIVAAVHISGVFDLEPLLHTSVNEKVGMDGACAQRNSPMRHVGAVTRISRARHLVLVGEHDSPEFRRQAREYASALKDAKCDATCHILPTRDHFDMCEALADADSDVMKLVKENLKDLIN